MNTVTYDDTINEVQKTRTIYNKNGRVLLEVELNSELRYLVLDLFRKMVYDVKTGELMKAELVKEKDRPRLPTSLNAVWSYVYTVKVEDSLHVNFDISAGPKVYSCYATVLIDGIAVASYSAYKR